MQKFETGGSDLMILGATREQGNVVLSRVPLLLHTEGVLVGHQPDMVLLYASKFSDEPKSGKTIIIDRQKTLAEILSALCAEPENKKFEY